MTFGEKIQKLRKQMGLSQEALAEKVTVTRQTVSKWELDQSTPDLEFIAQLSDIFGVSADYLIKEELTEPGEPLLKKKRLPISAKVKRILFALISASALIAVLVCLICDYLTSDALSWSLVSGVSIVAAWCLLLPCLTAKKNVLVKTLISFSLVPLPLLALLSLLLKMPVVFRLGACVTLVSVAALWVIYAIFRKCKKRIWLGFGFSLLVMIPLSLAVNHIALRFTAQPYDSASDFFNGAITLLLSLLCFGADYLRKGKKSDSGDGK